MFDNFGQKFINAFIDNGGYKLMIDGLWITLQIALSALIIGIVVGTMFAIMNVIPVRGIFSRILHIIADVYITVIRGTPVVVQLLLVYYGILSPLRVPAMIVAILVFGLNSSAYVAEIIRGGINAVDRGQMEAGRSLGLSYGSTMQQIILPQAVKNILPALGNEFIVLIKETSVAGFITLIDLTRAAQNIVNDVYEAFIPYLMLAAMYLVLVMIATFLVNSLERWMRRSD